MKYALQQTLISSPGLLSNCCCVTITAAGFKYESHGGKIFLRDIRARSAGLIAPKTLLPLWEMETNEFFISQPFPSISCHDLFFFSASVLWFMSLFLSWRIKAKGLGNSDNLQRISSNYEGGVPFDGFSRTFMAMGRALCPDENLIVREKRGLAFETIFNIHLWQINQRRAEPN